ncbi:YlzJ-like family protein [Metabacillus fastidiosus]|uniref:YlzJ-like family protein n=1 Tax=Metabacillus fastidiosus TaxID=1458 RepID=A0ABU6NXW0_9BACI|nr:YlzJ-like family protein [Metabacillus fastidiosus]MEC2076921.1 YlzJ-like family protein [Metabacillus fastidiosus]MED4401473.1 YlzJ-like family protein [Metabacillus fastidiosus]MED4452958.1 YlzJ-like family protein [Metabacillus fastidiosus]MED4463107.1 YlzJ-like family protein [Metabacillus fastidiosus]MED4532458.1 YlzJ-like family protein [Metabacillus fastidiosus]
MILYTMMPEEMVFPTLESEFGKQSIVQVNDMELLVRQTDTSDYEILRILSSNPNHFLNGQYCPGQKISAHLVCGSQ